MNTREVAQLLRVGPSAVKRWADAGRLACLKTPGGHRRFARAEVERFLRQQGAVAPERERWAAALLAARDPLAVEALLLEERASAGAWHPVAERVGAALAEIGRGWRAGQIAIADEHLLSERLARALARAVEAIALAPRAPVALLACADEDDHTLGLSLAELVLREAGWATLWAGRRLPLGELRLLLERGEARLVALSASEASSDAVGLRRQAGALGHHCRALGVALVLGGAGAWPERPRHGVRLRAFEPLHRLAVAERERLTGPAGA